jgi:hypothetical protein
MAGFTFKKPPTQEIKVSGYSDGILRQFVGVFNTYTEKELKAIYKEITEVQEGKDATNANSHYFEIANRLMIGWVNRPTDDVSWWVCEDDEITPMETTPELKQAMLEQGSVAYCVCEAFYKARQSSEAQVGNSKPSPSRGFRDMAKEANTKT